MKITVTCNKEYDNKKLYPCFSLRMARYLEYHGCELVCSKPNKNDPKFNVYYFEKCEHLDEIIEKYNSLTLEEKRNLSFN